MVTASSVPRLRRASTSPILGCVWEQYSASGVPGSGVNDMLGLLTGHFRKDLLCRLAQRRGGPQWSHRRVAEPQRAPWDRHASPRRVLDVGDHAALDQVLVGVDLTDRLDRRTRHTGGLQIVD